MAYWLPGTMLSARNTLVLSLLPCPCLILLLPGAFADLPVHPRVCPDPATQQYPLLPQGNPRPLAFIYVHLPSPSKEADRCFPQLP
jgi:hypothetical protein